MWALCISRLVDCVRRKGQRAPVCQAHPGTGKRVPKLPYNSMRIALESFDLSQHVVLQAKQRAGVAAEEICADRDAKDS